MKQHSSHPGGVILVEAMFGLALAAVIGGAVWFLLRDFDTSRALVGAQLTTQQEANRALKIITAEMRTASPSSLGAYPIVAATGSSVMFYSDTNADGLKERIRYFVNNNTLQRGSITPSGDPLEYNPGVELVTDLIHDVSNTDVFSYHDATYEGATTPLTEPVSIPDIRMVRIAVTIDANDDQPPSPTDVSTYVSLRNLKDNL